MNNILSLLESYTLDNADDIARALAEDFRKRRVEKNLTRITIILAAVFLVSLIVLMVVYPQGTIAS